MSSVTQDLRHAARWLARNPGFTAVAVATLALGIGANTAIFSVVRGILLRPLPYAQPGRLVQLWEKSERLGRLFDQVPFSPPVFRDWRDRNRSLGALTAYSSWTVNFTGGEAPERLSASLVTANFFDVLGVRPVAGRTFSADEELPGRDFVAVISEKLWARRFGRDPRAIGASMTLDGKSFAVIGIVQSALPLYDLDAGVEVYVPLSHGFALDNRRGHYLGVIGRLRPGVSLAAARSDLASVAAQLGREHPDSDREFQPNVVPLQEQTVGSVRPALLTMFGAVAVVLLIAVVNVANMLLARAASRRKEIAVRAALGSGRGRLLRQLLTESLLVALAGCIAGVLLAFWGLDLLKSLAPSDIPRLEDVRIDWTVGAFAVGASLLAGLAFGLVPAWQVSSVALASGLKDRGASAGRSGSRLRGFLVGAELALSLILVVGAALLLQSFTRLRNARLGFDPERVVTFQIDLPESRYPHGPEIAAFHERLLGRLWGLPGVQSVATVTGLPLTGDRTMNLAFQIENRPHDPSKVITAHYESVSPGYFPLMRIPLLRGRVFFDGDVAGATRVAVVSESMASVDFPGEDPVGKRISLSDDRNPEDWATIVGVVGSVRDVSPDHAPEPEMYMPFAQHPIGGMAVLVRSGRDARSLATELRAQVAALDPQQPVHTVRTMDRIVSDSLGQPRFRTLLLTLFGAVALLLAAVGVYGVVAYSVAQRTREIGIRMALGAAAADVLRLVLRQVLRLSGIAVAVGVAGGLALSRTLASLLYGVTPTDPATFAGVALLLLAVASLAAYVPARRASRVDPTIALRHE